MKTNLKTLSALLLLSMLFASCDNKDNQDTPTPTDAKSCDTSNSQFKQLYAAAPLTNQITYDSEIHSYNFEVTANHKICSIGYQSQPGLATTPYLMEIEDVSTPGSPIVIGTLSALFSSTATSYVSFATPVTVLVGRKYKMKRIQTMWGSNIGLTIGRLKTAPSGAITFPLTFGDLVITSTSLYQMAQTSNNWGLPCIDIVFI